MTNRSALYTLLLLLGATAVFLTCSDNAPSKEKRAMDVMSTTEDHPATSTYQAQRTADNPREESVDPFFPNEDFEILMKSAQNKSDFDFSFAAFAEQTPEYTLRNGALDFVLEGSLRTSVNLQDNTTLSLTFYDNDQVSFTRRQSHAEYLLPYAKVPSAATSTEKKHYRFNFTQTMKMNPGLHYFVIAPKGRNRVLYIRKFMVR